MPAGTSQTVTGLCDGDLTTSVCDALKEYIEDFVPWGPDERPLFKHVCSVWSDTEDNTKYPGASVTSAGKASESPDTSYSPVYGEDDETVTVDGRLCKLATTAMVTIPVAIEVYCTSTEQRRRVMMWVERMFSPSETNSGLLLSLPRYYGARVQFSIQSTEFLDTAANVQKRYRLARILLTASGPKVVPYPARFVTVEANAV